MLSSQSFVAQVAGEGPFQLCGVPCFHERPGDSVLDGVDASRDTRRHDGQGHRGGLEGNDRKALPVGRQDHEVHGRVEGRGVPLDPDVGDARVARMSLATSSETGSRFSNGPATRSLRSGIGPADRARPRRARPTPCPGRFARRTPGRGPSPAGRALPVLVPCRPRSQEGGNGRSRRFR